MSTPSTHDFVPSAAASVGASSTEGPPSSEPSGRSSVRCGQGIADPFVSGQGSTMCHAGCREV